MSEHHENKPKVTPEVEKFFKEVMASKEFYDFASHLMYKYKKF